MGRGVVLIAALVAVVAAGVVVGSDRSVEPAASVPPSVGVADLGSLVISGVDGTTASSALKRRVRRGDVAGVILMGENIRSVGQVRALTRSLRAAARAGGQLEPLVLVDQEGGTVKRFASAAPNRSARQMGRMSASAVRRIGSETARDLAARGVNVDLAPVADVVSRRGNFLGTRAFGTSPSVVATSACAFADGLTGEGVGASLKHFPGLGAGGPVNTDDGRVRITASRSVIESGWSAYRRCGSKPLTTVMVSSASYPAVYGSRQALVNPAVYKDLREKLAFDGVVMTDALNAAAVRLIRSVDVRSVEAGADLLLHLEEGAAARATRRLRSAFRSGSLKQADVADSVERVRKLRKALAGD